MPGTSPRALDLAAMVKEDDGARGAIVYINGETDQTFFDDLNVSSLDLPITTYVGRDGFENSPEGYGDLSRYPATVVMWKNRRIVEVYNLSQQELRDLDTSGRAKEILVRYLDLFDK